MSPVSEVEEQTVLAFDSLAAKVTMTCSHGR